MCAQQNGRRTMNYLRNPIDINALADEAIARAVRLSAQKEKTNTTNQSPVSPASPKYYLTNDIIDVDGHKLQRIQAARDIPEIGVQEGDLGGFIESERNLSHKGTCWVFAGCVYEQAQITGGATVRGEKVRIHDSAILSDGFTAYDSAHLHGHFRGSGCAKACGRADAGDYAIQKGSSYLAGSAIMRGHAILGGNARADGSTVMTQRAEFCGNFETFGGNYTSGVMGRSAGDCRRQKELQKIR